MDTPILLIHFNRPDISRQQIESLALIAPKRVWILCDGPRPSRESDKEKVVAVRQLLDDIPWDCVVKRLYREENLGCFRNISSGISWFLKDCEGGIILEDDCVADPSFFRFCSELLDYYREDSSVCAISGHTGRNEAFPFEGSYGFSNYFGCWGWATWKRAWDSFDPDLAGWHDRQEWRSVCQRVIPKVRSRLYWNWIFRQVATGRLDTWAYRYLLSIWKVKGIVVFPNVNLVNNIGAHTDGTHAGQADTSRLPLRSIDFPLRHPPAVGADTRIDAWFEDNAYSKSFLVRLRWILRKLRGS